MAINMTTLWLDRLKPPASGRVEHFDSTVPGLVLRVSAKGTKTWVVQYHERGRDKRRVSIGRCPPISLAEARERAREMLMQYRQELVDPFADRQAAQGAPTLAALAAEYLERYAKPQKRTWKKDERLLTANVLPVLGDRRAGEIKRREVVDLLEAIRDRGAPIEANRTLACLRKVYNWAISRDMVDANPCSQIKAPALERQRDRVLSDGELRAIWRACDHVPPIPAAHFRLMILTAQRGHEVTHMRWPDIVADWWTIPAGMAKNRMSHRVPLSRPALAILEGLPRSGEWVMPSPAHPGGPWRDMRQALAVIRDRSGVDFVPHDLRRTAASHMASMGVPRLVISKILNHVEAGVTRVYDRHSYDREKREALDLWAERLMGVVG